MTDEVVWTFRRGPSDPVRFEDGPGTVVEITVAADVDRVWALVTDIDMPARFSEEFLGAEWLTDGPALGARFVGRNQHPAIGEWQTESTVVEHEPPRTFAWAVGGAEDPGATWRYVLEGDDRETSLRFEVTLGPGLSGTTMAIASMPDKEDRIIHRRISELNANMRRTVEGIKAAAEQR